MTAKKNTKPTGAKSTPRKPKAAPHMIASDDLGALLAAAFTHPLLPYSMRDHMEDALCEVDDTFDKYGNPEVMREVLGLNERGGAV